MITVKANTTLVGVTELRHKIDKVIEETKRHMVIVERRNKPVAAFISIEEYEKLLEMKEDLEDRYLGELAAKRGKNIKERINHSDMKKHFGIK